MGDKKIKIESYNMNEGNSFRFWAIFNTLIDMKLRAIEFVMSQEKSKTMELELAKGLKKDFDTRFHPTWQCVVGKALATLLMVYLGKNFGSDIGFEDKHMIYFYMGSTAILLWRAG